MVFLPGWNKDDVCGNRAMHMRLKIILYNMFECTMCSFFCMSDHGAIIR